MSSEADRRTRRTEGVQTRGRAARVVADVLRATAEELGRVGYAALRFEDIAARSGVNKTTIYRRWPTKPDLVAAALQESGDEPPPPDTGSLREDLLQSARQTIARADSPIGRGLMRMLQAERADPEVEAIVKALREKHRRTRIAMIERAVKRGDLPEETNAELVIEVIFAPFWSRLFRTREPVTEGFVAEVIDLVLAGARAKR